MSGSSEKKTYKEMDLESDELQVKVGLEPAQEVLTPEASLLSVQASESALKSSASFAGPEKTRRSPAENFIVASACLPFGSPPGAIGLQIGEAKPMPDFFGLKSGNGLKRHRNVIAVCLCFAGLIMAMSTLDSKHSLLVSTTLDHSLRALPEQANPELPPNYSFEEGSSYKEGLRTVIANTWDGERYGCVDEKGALKIRAKFGKIEHFSEGLAAAYMPSKSKSPEKYGNQEREPFGFINKSGKWVIPPKFEYVDEFKEGVAPVLGKDGSGGLIDQSGKFLYKGPMSSLPQRFGPNYRVQDLNGYYGLMSPKGKWIVEPNYYGLSKMEESYKQNSYYIYNQINAPSGESNDEYLTYLQASRNGEQSVIDSLGNILIKPTKYKLYSYNKGHAIAHTGQKFGVIDSSGKVVIPSQLDDFNGFDDMTAYDEIMAVCRAGKWSLIDSSGKPIKTSIKIGAPIVDLRGSWFSSGLAPVMMENGKVGFINAKGEMQIAPIFDFASPFHEGYSAVYYKGHFRFIKADGTFASPLKFARISPFFRGEATVSLEGPLYFLTRPKDNADMESSLENWRNRNIAHPNEIEAPRMIH
ncbi:MAG: WG repeat-containing protein [Candidatus Obscuribacterales bacterium]|nr:WG repeat-containing protein [Candidatus Obscuribacterales bacterium]